MSRLTIKNFSCIDSAEIDLDRIVVLIGPQASGKSVISKLMYFFVDTLDDITGQNYEFEEMPFEKFTKNVEENFKKRFPPQAWGGSAFELCLEYGPFTIKIVRSKPRKTNTEKIRVELSDSAMSFYNDTQKKFEDARAKLNATSQEKASNEWDILYRIRRSSVAEMKSLLKEDYIGYQFFIPARRSFFTSMGKAVVAIEHMGSLDALTVQFGKIFLSMRDNLGGLGFRYRSTKSEKTRKEREDASSKLAEKLFSGQIKIEKNDEYIESKDGRKTPFALMSSGQQELLPLWITVNEILGIEQEGSLIYIEEPEAHLFPTSQGILIEYLANITASGQRMFITTHSPYILSKLNNLLKAGSLAAKLPKKDHATIEKVVPREAWIRPNTIGAYAIVDRKLIWIVGDDGLIDGEYLDEVSGDISREFNSLLEIEYVR